MPCNVCDLKLAVGTECFTSFKTFTCGPCKHEFAAPKNQLMQYRGLIYGQHVFRYYQSVHCPQCYSRLYTLGIDCDDFKFRDSPSTPNPIRPEEIQWLFSSDRPKITLQKDS